MDIARVAFPPDTCNSYLRFVHVFPSKTRRIKHRLRCPLRTGLGDPGTNLVQSIAHEFLHPMLVLKTLTETVLQAEIAVTIWKE